jgi:hypothetical protein
MPTATSSSATRRQEDVTADSELMATATYGGVTGPIGHDKTICGQCTAARLSSFRLRAQQGLHANTMRVHRRVIMNPDDLDDFDHP